MQYRIPLKRKHEALDLLRAEPFCPAPTPEGAERLLSLMVVRGKDLVLDTSLLPRRPDGDRRDQRPTESQAAAAAGSIGKLRTAGRIIKGGAHAAKSVAKTTLGIDRATDEQVEARLDVCRQCPGGHAVWRDDEVHTCGPMLASMRNAGEGTCGCILRKKSRDLTEDCPFGWWPKSTIGNPTTSV